MVVSFEYDERRETMKLERDGINPTKKPTGTGCVECLKRTDGGYIFHLHQKQQK